MDSVYLYQCPGGKNNSHALLTAALKDYYRRIGRPVPDLRLARDQRGRPFLPGDTGTCFSISHSGEYWLCAIAPFLVGLDAQITQKVRLDAIARRFFHPEEQAYFAAHPDSFFQLWTAKESLVKWLGVGIDHNFSRRSVIKDGAYKSGGVTFQFLPTEEAYTLCLCAKNPCQVIRVRDFAPNLENL